MTNPDDKPGARLTRQQNLLPDLLALIAAHEKYKFEHSERMANRNPNRRTRKTRNGKDAMSSPAAVITRRDIYRK